MDKKEISKEGNTLICCIFEQIAEVMETAGVDYIKMDMNRHLTDVYSCGSKRQNRESILHKYVLGAALMFAGLPIPCMSGEYQTHQVHFIKEDD